MARHKPFARGVGALMYVSGDDVPATQASTIATPAPTKEEYAVGAGALLVAYKSRGIVRLAAAGIAAWVGYKAYRSQKTAP